MNWFAIAAAVVVNQVIGFIWYSQIFGKTWLAETGRMASDVHSTTALIVSALSALLMAIGLSCMLRNQNADTACKGVKTGFMVWLAFVGPVLAMHYLYLGHSWTVIAIDAAEQLVALKVMGAILAVWRKK